MLKGFRKGFERWPFQLQEERLRANLVFSEAPKGEEVLDPLTIILPVVGVTSNCEANFSL